MTARLLWALVPAWVLARAGTARADDTTELEGLLEEPLVAGVSKSTESASAAPAMTTIVTAAELRRFGIRSLDEAINFLATGMTAETPLTAAEVGTRGVVITQDYGAHVLVLLDGHALNEVWGGTAYFDRGAAIPFELIDHIEFMLGPGSVLYGSNAMLGVINIVTKRARDYRGLHAAVETEILPGGEGLPGWSLRSALGAGFEFDVDGTPGEVTFGGEYYNLEGPKFRFGPQDYGVDGVTGLPRVFSNESPPGVWGGLADTTYYARIPAGYARFVLGDFELKFRGAWNERSFPYHGGNFDDPENRELDRWLSLDASYRIPVGSQVQLFARLYGDLYDYQQFYPSNAAEDCLEGQLDGCLYYLEGTARWGGLEVNGSFDWLGDERFVTLLGADGRVKNVSSHIDTSDLVTGDLPPPAGVVDVTELGVGIYAQQSMRAATWLSFSSGVRLDLDERYGGYASPRFAVLLSPWKGSAFKGIYSKAFRAPTAFERYYEDETSQIEAPDLSPEVVRGIEGSFEQRFGTQRVEVGVFQSSWKDLVITEALSDAEVQAAVDRGDLAPGTDYAEQTKNAASIESYGVTARFDGSALKGQLTYGTSVTWAHARRTDPGGEPVELVAAASIFGNARIAYDFADGWPVVALASRLVGNRIANLEGPTGAPDVAPPQVELRGTVSGPFPELLGLSYRVSGSYAFSDVYPYTVGPAVKADGTSEFAPVDQIKIAIGLAYDLDFLAQGD